MGKEQPLGFSQARTHAGHSHGHGHGHHHHHHHHDTTYLTSSNRADPGVKITRVGLFVNLGMAIGKGAGGYYFNSKALTADAVHALSDLVSDFATLATVSYSLKPSNALFPFGYGKIESVGALAVSSLLLVGGFGIGLQAIVAISQQFFPEIGHLLSHLFEHVHVHDHSHHHHHATDGLGPNINAAWLAGGSILVKEWLYRATMKVAKAKRSSVLASNAYHHRVDSLTAFVALLTICASHFLPNAQWLDPIGGLVISGMIVQAGITNFKSAFLELVDVGMDEDISQSVKQHASAAVSDHLGGQALIRGVQGIKSGQNILVDVEVAVPKTYTIAETTALEEVIRERVGEKVRGVRRLAIRFVSNESTADAFRDQFLEGRADDTIENEHDHDHDHDHNTNGHQHLSTNGQVKSTGMQVNGSAEKRK